MMQSNGDHATDPRFSTPEQRDRHAAQLRSYADLIEEGWPDEVGAQQAAHDLRRMADELEQLGRGD